MKILKLSFFLLATSLFIQCAPNSEGDATQEESAGSEKVSIEIPDTTRVTVMFMKIMGQENMLEADYAEGQSEEDLILASENHSYFKKLVRVELKGASFSGEDEEGFKESSNGAVKSKVITYNMTYMEKSEVEQPFRVSIISQVKDYLTWKMLFDMEEKNRTNAGMKLLQLGTRLGDGNNIFMLLGIEDIDKARDMMEQPGLEAKMQQSGVIGQPVVKFWRLAGPQTEEL